MNCGVDCTGVRFAGVAYILTVKANVVSISDDLLVACRQIS